MEDLFVLDLKKKNVVVGDKPKVDKMAKVSMGSCGRKTLADISNMQRRPTTFSQSKQEYIEQLQKENAALMKLLADKNKIIELTGAELHKLRITLQKMQQQNVQLAQANNQMLMELNEGKEKRKTLQHELGCLNGLLIAKKLEAEGKVKSETFQANDKKMEKAFEHKDTGVCTVAETDNDERCNTSRRKKSKSLGPSAKKVQDHDMGSNGRLRTRRQSAMFRPDEPKQTEEILEIYNFNLSSSPLHDDNKMQVDDSKSVLLSFKKENEEDDALPNYKTQEQRRSSILRPSRHAAAKIQSYTEPKLNVKMRRPE